MNTVYIDGYIKIVRMLMLIYLERYISCYLERKIDIKIVRKINIKIFRKIDSELESYILRYLIDRYEDI